MCLAVLVQYSESAPRTPSIPGVAPQIDTLLHDDTLPFNRPILITADP